MPAVSLLRARTGLRGVTNIELFFDLVYAFAVTQLSHYLLDHATVDGVIQAAVLFGMVWTIWASTAYLVNWLDPHQLPVRRLLLAVMVVSLISSAAIPEAFGPAGLFIGASYGAVQIGRNLFAVYATRHEALERNFQRFFVWSLAGGSLAIIGGLAQGHVREVLWALVVAIDLFSAAVGFYVPGLGRTATREWNVDGAHAAERIQAFVMITLGESIVIIGASLTGFKDLYLGEVIAYLLAFVTTVALWWIYFDRSAAFAASALASSPDPGRLARSAFYWAQVPMVAGIIAVPGATVLACSATSNRVVVANVGGLNDSSDVWVLDAATATIKYHRTYLKPTKTNGNVGVFVVASPDGQYLAETDAATGSATIRHIPDDVVVSRLSGMEVHGFSWHGDLVLAAPRQPDFSIVNSSMANPVVIDWRTTTTVWRSPAGTSFGGRLAAQPGGKAIAFGLGGAPHYGIWVVGPDGRGRAVDENIQFLVTVLIGLE
jgi:low temperature requirement protein LtrA